MDKGEKKVYCFSCKKYYKVKQLIEITETTDIFEGLDWGIPHWKEYHNKCCPRCRWVIIRDGKTTLWKMSKTKRIVI